MAPEETRTISRSPPLRLLARTSTSASTRSASSPPEAVVSDEEPTLTTILRASLTACLAPATLFFAPCVGRRLPAWQSTRTGAEAAHGFHCTDRRSAVTVCSRPSRGRTTPSPCPSPTPSGPSFEQSLERLTRLIGFEAPHRLFSEVPADLDPADLYEEADFSGLTGDHG